MGFKVPMIASPSFAKMITALYVTIVANGAAVIHIPVLTPFLTLEGLLRRVVQKQQKLIPRDPDGAASRMQCAVPQYENASTQCDTDVA